MADLATALGVSKAAIYYHYRSKDALLHRLVDPLLDAIDTCITSHSHPPLSADAARQLRTLLVAPDPSVPATLRAAAALGAIWRPLITEPEIDLAHTPYRQTLIDAALATLDARRSSSDGGSRRPSEPAPARDSAAVAGSTEIPASKR